MSYNSARDELFLADAMRDASARAIVRIVRTMRVRDNAGDLRDVYRARYIYSVCHMSDSDTLLVGSREYVWWLVALSRNGSEWREQTDGGVISCALNDSRVLIGRWKSTYMELFRVESGPRSIACGPHNAVYMSN